MMRLFAFLIGLGAVALVIWLGFRAFEDPRYVLWFGLASALVAPVGLGLLGFALLGSDRAAFTQLSKVPQIKELIEQAESEEDRIQLLEREREYLDSLVRYEAEKMALEARRESLESDGARILRELETIERLGEGLNLAEPSEVVVAEIQRLRERLNAAIEGDVVIRLRNKDLIIRRRDLASVFLFGESLYEILKLFADFQQKWYRKQMAKREQGETSDEV